MENRTKDFTRWRSRLLAGFILAGGSLSSAYGAMYFSSVGPLSGPPGTVVTISGSGLTNITTAWVGAAHDAGVTNVSGGTSVQITIPKDATTGSIGIYNGSQWGFTAQTFTVTAASTSGGTSSS